MHTKYGIKLVRFLWTMKIRFFCSWWNHLLCHDIGGEIKNLVGLFVLLCLVQECQWHSKRNKKKDSTLTYCGSHIVRNGCLLSSQRMKSTSRNSLWTRWVPWSVLEGEEGVVKNLQARPYSCPSVFAFRTQQNPIAAFLCPGVCASWKRSSLALGQTCRTPSCPVQTIRSCRELLSVGEKHQISL